jgi:hypothetical protein
VTLVVGGAPADALDDEGAASDEELADEAARLLQSGLSARDVADTLSARTGQPRRRIYALVTKVASAQSSAD